MLCCPTTILKWLIWNFSCTPYNLCPGYDWIILTEGIRKLEEEFLSLCDKGCLKRCIMEKVKGLPYGVARFEEVRNENFYYVDKTMYLPLLEATSKYLFLIRPRRFGKSMFVSMMEAYYDIAKADRFNTLFDGLWIQRNPTPLKNSFQGRFLIVNLK